jgi:hypothetical protein
MARSRKIVRLYFRAQAIATLAEFVFQKTEWYALVYCMCVLLVMETNIFMLLDEGTTWGTLRGAVTFAAAITTAALFGLSHIESWIVLAEGFMLAALGTALLQTSYTIIGTLTLGMAWYDFMWLMSSEIRDTNTWAPSSICAAAFLLYAWRSYGQRPIRIS